ncbi:SGNH/GDSL hydrolase family protein (plasmid) [Caballeronia sp. S22]
MNRAQSIMAAIAAGLLLNACGGGSSSSDVAQAVKAPTTSSPNLVAIGDSLTEGVGSSNGGYPAVLSGMLNDKPYANLGIGGQTSTQIASRIGALSSAVTLDGNAVPASTTAVSVLSLSIDLLSTPADDTARSKSGSLCSVHGVLQRTAVGGPPSTSEIYTFTRDAPGQAVSCSPASAFLADSEGYDAWTAIIWVGRNNYDDVATVVADVKAIVQWLKPSSAHFAVLSVIKGEFSYEYAGALGAQHIDQINAELEAAYPDNFVDIETVLVNSYDPNLPQDVMDHMNNIPPTSLRSDTVHLNDAGYGIVAAQLKSFISARNW